LFTLLNDQYFKKISKYLIRKGGDPSITAAYSTDFGGVKVAYPEAVFLPETVSQLQLFIHLAQKHKVKVNIRGQGHSMDGHALLDEGVIIDLKNINAEIQFSSTHENAVEVPAFLTWHDVIKFTLKNQLTVPVLTDYLDLSVGGTLSYGGLGGCSFKYGSQADNVLSLEVLTYQGEILVCSKNQNPQLFRSVLCGLGQIGIILKATIPLVQAKIYVEYYQCYYDNLSDFISDQVYLSQKFEVDYLKGSIKKLPENNEYIIEVACFYNDQSELMSKPTINALKSQTTEKEIMNYYDFIRQVTDFINLLSEQNLLNVSHPWYNILMPENEIMAHTRLALDNPYLTGEAPVIIYPIHSQTLKQPFFKKPKTDIIFLFGLLYNCGLNAEINFPYEDVIKFNQRLYQDAHKRGGCCYPVGNTHSDWKEHFGSKWLAFKTMKRTFDPSGIYGSKLMEK